MLTILSAVVVFIAILAATAYFYPNKKSSSTATNDYAKKNLMTENEMEFFKRLLEALPQHHVFSQVSLGALLDANVRGDKSKRSSVRGTFTQKIADFVVCDKNLNVVAVVELDDKTHRAQNDAKRDAMLEQAGYAVVRWDSKKKPSISEIASRLALVENPPQLNQVPSSLALNTA